MDLLTDDIRRQLLANGSTEHETDHIPVVKYFDPTGAATWIITEMVRPEDIPVEPVMLFGLCDLGLGCPELGYVSLAELESIRGRLGLGVERDLQFKARFPLSVYAYAAQVRGRIVDSEALLAETARALGVRGDFSSTPIQVPSPELPSAEPKPQADDMRPTAADLPQRE